MKNGKKFVLYIIVFITALLIVFLFTKIFKFDKKITTEYPEVTETEINELYKLFPEKNINNNTTFYMGSYVSNTNINYTDMSLIAYNYIERTDNFKFESITKEDENLVGEGYKLLYKIDKEYFLKTVEYIFGKTNYYIIDFKIDETKSAKIKDDYNYIYIYEANNSYDSNIVYFKGLESYTVENGNESIKIIEYFLKCNKTTKICYDNEGQSESINNNITYSENLNIKDYKDKLKKYEHKFCYEDGHYRYESTKQI